MIVGKPFCLLLLAALIFQVCITHSSALNSDQIEVLRVLQNHWSISSKTGLGAWASITDNACDALAPAQPDYPGILCSEDQTVVTQLNLQAVSLNGTIPKELFELRNLTRLVLNVNKLEGSIPSQIGNLTNLVSIFLSYNYLSGTIPRSVEGMISLKEWVLGHSQLSGTIPNEFATLPMLDYVYMENNRLSGTIPPRLISRSALRALRLDRNKLTGSVPNITSDWSYLNLNNNSLDLCPNGLSIKVSSNAIECNIAGQDGKQSCGVNCQEIWRNASCSFDSILPEPCPNPPSICSGVRPSPSFECYGGTWVANSSIDVDVLTIGGGTTQITGNVTIRTSLTFDGLGILLVDECLRFLNGSIILDLSESDLENLASGSSKTKTLIKSKSNSTLCGEGDVLQTVPISVSQPNSCKKASISSVGGESRTALTVGFEVDRSRCSRWWIVLASVLGVVVLLVVIAVVSISVYSAKRRNKVPPSRKTIE